MLLDYAGKGQGRCRFFIISYHARVTAVMGFVESFGVWSLQFGAWNELNQFRVRSSEFGGKANDVRDGGAEATP